MEIFDFILDVVLLVSSALYVLGAVVTDDDTKEIKYLLWAILFVSIVYGSNLINV